MPATRYHKQLLDRSKYTTPTLSLFWKAPSMSLTRRTIWFVVDLHLRKPAWACGRFIFTMSSMRARITLSISLYVIQSSEIGL